MSLPFAAGPAPAEWLSTFELLQRSLLDRHRPLPLPVSFLLDRRGQIAYIYKGPVEVDQLLADIDRLDDADASRAEAYPLAGTLSGAPSSIDYARIADAFLDASEIETARFYLAEARRTIGPAGPGGPRQALFARGLLRLGAAYVDAGRFGEARPILEEALAYDEKDAVTHQLLGRIELAADNYDAAEKCFREAIALDDHYGGAWVRLGAIRFGRRDVDGAREAYEHAIAVDPELGEAWLALGILQLTTQDVQGGLASFRKATALDPDSSMAWTGLGTCLYMTRDVSGAISALERAVALDPANGRAQQTLEAIRRSGEN